MKDWRNCKELPYRQEKIQLQGKEYITNSPQFEYCLKCRIKECKGKIAIKAKREALRFLTKVI